MHSASNTNRNWSSISALAENKNLRIINIEDNI